VQHFKLSDDERARLQIREAIGRRIGRDASDLVHEPLPDRLVELLRRLRDVEQRKRHQGR
jgi:hypothetical protein